MRTRTDLLLLILALSPLSLHADRGLILRHKRPVPNSYIVVFKDSVAQTEITAVAHELALAHDAQIARSGNMEAVFQWALHGFAASMSDVAEATIALDPRVSFVEEDAYGQTSDTRSLADFYPPPYNTPDYRRWNLDRIDETQSVMDSSFQYRGDRSYSYQTNGTGVYVYVFDSGVQANHSEFGGRVLEGVEFSDNPAGPYFPYSPCGGELRSESSYPIITHGTATASVAGGATVGVANGVYIVPIKVVQCEGEVTRLSWWCWGMDWVASPSNPNLRCPNQMDPNQLCLGVLTTSMFIDPAITFPPVIDVPLPSFESAVTNVIMAGVTVVASANNQGGDACNGTPARLAYGNRDSIGDPRYRVITVGGTDELDRLWKCTNSSPIDCPGPTEQELRTGSNTGRCVDIYAPAHGLKLAAMMGPNSYRTDLISTSGTSFAAPYVAGLLARILQHWGWQPPSNMWLELQWRAFQLPANFDGDGIPVNDLLARLSATDF